MKMFIHTLIRCSLAVGTPAAVLARHWPGTGSADGVEIHILPFLESNGSTPIHSFIHFFYNNDYNDDDDDSLFAQDMHIYYYKKEVSNSNSNWQSLIQKETLVLVWTARKLDFVCLDLHLTSPRRVWPPEPTAWVEQSAGLGSDQLVSCMQHKSSIIILEKGAHVVTDMITIRYFSTFGLEVFSDTADSSGMRLRQQQKKEKKYLFI